MKNLKVQINNKFVKECDSFVLNEIKVLVTPPLDEDYWIFRVPLTETQAVVAFPKFSTYGIGFQKEKDWNRNLPYQESAEVIYNHIKHNKGDVFIRKKMIIEAIELLQTTIVVWNLKRVEG